MEPKKAKGCTLCSLPFPLKHLLIQGVLSVAHGFFGYSILSPLPIASSLLILLIFLSWGLSHGGQVQGLSQLSSLLTPVNHPLLLIPSSSGNGLL